MTKTSNSKNNTKSNALQIKGCSIQFLESTSVPGSVGNVWFTPDQWNGLETNVASVYNSMSALNAIRDFLAGTYQKAGDFVHVINPKSSRYDGLRSFYLGGNIVMAAIAEGHSSITVQVAEKSVTIGLPAADDTFGPFKVHEVFGEWTRVVMSTDFWGRAMPATDSGHRNNIVYKHMYLDKLMSGTMLRINTDPAVNKENQLFMKGSNEAKLLREELFNVDGTPKSDDELIAPYNERKLMYAGDSKLDRQTAHMQKVAPIIGTKILSIIRIENQEKTVDVTQVPEGVYQFVDAMGNIRNYSFRVDGSLRSQNNLRTGATNGWILRPLNVAKK